MKITLDISKLVEEGKLTREEADKLTALAAHDTGSLGRSTGAGWSTSSPSSPAFISTPNGSSTSAPHRCRCCSVGW